MTAHFRCSHGFYSHGTRGVKCPTCTGAISAPLKQGWPLTVGKVYAGCKLLGQPRPHILTVACSQCDNPAQISKSYLLQLHSRGDFDWRCPSCRRFTRRDQVTTQAVGRDADVPPGYRAGRAL